MCERLARRTLVYLCNAIDDETCKKRHITSDSPAATQKVFQISTALSCVGIKPLLLSLGRGRQRNTWRWHPAAVKRVKAGGVLVYAPFFDAPVLTHFVTLFSVCVLIFRLNKRKLGDTVALAYNRLPYYFLGLMLARGFGWRCFLDLEDGEVIAYASLRSKCIAALGKSINRLCNSGALLAASALAMQYPNKNSLCCYGVSGENSSLRSWHGSIRILLGGSLQHETGATLLIDAIKLLRSYNDPMLKDLEFVVTGKGAMAPELREVSECEGWPRLSFLGSLSRNEYRKLIDETHVGLCLKLVSSCLANTTFPSKVVEISSSGMLLLSTCVSDVPCIFKRDEALFLKDEEPKTLASACYWVLKNRSEAFSMAQRGQRKAQVIFSKGNVGCSLKEFFFSESIK